MTEIKKDIYWVGAVDWNIRHFHGYTYSTPRGTTYNAYLIKDQKTALIDTVYAPFTDRMVEAIREVMDPAAIDYIIANHVEDDHSGALPRLLRLCPKAKVVCDQRCKEGLQRHYYGDWDFQVVKTGDELSLGRRTLKFIEAPMIHWPDSMFTYCPQEKLLLPNDAFGQHIASSERFADQIDPAVLMAEAKAYYANILWPLGDVILRKIDELQKSALPIEMIAPSHGLIWRSSLIDILKAYVSWSKQETQPAAVIVYETMWQATAVMARLIAEGLAAQGVSVRLFDINVSDRTEVFTAMLDSKAFIIGSSTHDGMMLPGIAGFLHMLKGFKPKDRIACAFGSYGWSGGAVKEIEEVLRQAGAALPLASCSVKYVPDGEQRQACRRLGEELAGKIRAGV